MSEAPILVPRFEPDVIEVEAWKHYRGDTEKVATTLVGELMRCGVAITRRYGNANKLVGYRERCGVRFVNRDGTIGVLLPGDAASADKGA